MKKKKAVQENSANAMLTPTGDLTIFEAEPFHAQLVACLLYTSPSPRDVEESRMPSSA